MTRSHFAKSIRHALFTALILAIGGCASAPREAGGPLDRSSAMRAPTALKASESGTPEFQPVGRLIVYTGYIAIEVGSIKDIEPKIANVVNESKGYMAESRLGESEYTATLRVPTQSLNSVMTKLTEIGSLVRRYVRTEDVTDQHIDYEAKLKNLETLRNQLRDLLAKAKGVKEALEVEQELSQVQSQIDSLQGQLTALNNRIAYSTLEVRVTPKRIYGPVGYVFRGVWWVVEKLFVIR